MRVVVFLLSSLFSQYVFAQVDLTNWRNKSCIEQFKGVLKDHKEEADKLFAEANTYWTRAQSAKRTRGDLLPGQKDMSLENWRNSIRSEAHNLSMVVRKLDAARKVYDHYDRPVLASGWQKYIKWRPARKTWYAYHIEHIIADRRCYQKTIVHDGSRISVHLAAKSFDQKIKREVERWKDRVKELEQRHRWLEEIEVQRLNPEKYSWCMGVAQKHTSNEIARQFCGKVDGIGQNKLMPFVACISNLRYWGYKNGRTSELRRYSDKKTWSTRYFNACNKMDNIQAMLGGESWSDCMGRVRFQYTFPSDAGRFCQREHNTVVVNAARDGRTGPELIRENPHNSYMITSE